jgi:(p)ppGpp synthase/HD superfamily hydrolase
MIGQVMFESAMSTVKFDKDWQDFRVFAIDAHSDQTYGKYPYAYHLAVVESVLAEHGFAAHEYRAAAWLHDVIEDTDAELRMIGTLYGTRVASLVWACTGEGKNRKEKANEIYRRLKVYPDAAPVKVADRIANMDACIKAFNAGTANKLKMYVKEWETFRTNVEPLMEANRNATMLWAVLVEMMDKSKELLDEKKAGQEESCPASSTRSEPE